MVASEVTVYPGLTGMNPNTTVVMMTSVGPAIQNPYYFYTITGTTGGVTGTSILLNNSSVGDTGKVAWAVFSI
jgi:hypothetical protein